MRGDAIGASIAAGGGIPSRLFPILPLLSRSDLERGSVRLQGCPHARRGARRVTSQRDRNVPNQPSSEAGPGESPTLSPVAPPSSASGLRRNGNS